MKISDVEKIVGMSSKTIRYYESRGLLTVSRRDNSYREYDDKMIETLKNIKLMRTLGISVADIRLWHDNVVSFQELIVKRMRELENDTKVNESQRLLCELTLSGGRHPSSGDKMYSDPELDRVSPDTQINGGMAIGIDIGTTSISAQVISIVSGKPVQTYNITHNTAVASDDFPDAYSEDAESLLHRTLSLVDSLINTYPGVKSIGITGQMHGIVCLDADGGILSPLYTWQNEFALRKENGISYLEQIERLCGEKTSAGYGLATFYCLGKMGLLPDGTAAVSTIMDLAVMRLCGNTKVISHPTNAASLGFYNLNSSSFKTDKIKKIGIPLSVLPEIRDGFSIAGTYRGIPVSSAIGDNQAGVFGSLASDRQMLVNIGTSSQISVVTDCPDFENNDVRPYFGGRYIISGAALCGGRAYSLLADFFSDVLKLGNVKMSKSALYEEMNLIAFQPIENKLKVSTKFSGTRIDTDVRGSIGNLGTNNFTMRHFVNGILYGIAEELYEMYENFSDESFSCEKCDRDVVISGNAVRRNPMLQKIVGEVFGKTPVIPEHIEEAAFGAALFCALSAKLIETNDISKFIKFI